MVRKKRGIAPPLEIYRSSLYLKSNHGHIGVVHEILTDAPIEEMGDSLTAMGAHAN